MEARLVSSGGDDLISQVDTNSGLLESPIEKYVTLVTKIDQKTTDDYAMKLCFVTVALWSDAQTGGLPTQTLTQVGSATLQKLLILKPKAEAAIEVLRSFRANRLGETSPDASSIYLKFALTDAKRSGLAVHHTATLQLIIATAKEQFVQTRYEECAITLDTLSGPFLDGLDPLVLDHSAINECKISATLQLITCVLDKVPARSDATDDFLAALRQAIPVMIDRITGSHALTEYLVNLRACLNFATVADDSNLNDALQYITKDNQTLPNSPSSQSQNGMNLLTRLVRTEVKERCLAKASDADLGSLHEDINALPQIDDTVDVNSIGATIQFQGKVRAH